MRNIVSQKRHIRQTQKSWYDSCLSCLGKIDLCRNQSPQLTSYLQNFQQVSLYTDPYYGRCYLLECFSIDQLRILRKQKHNQKQANQRQAVLAEISNFNNNPNVINQEFICKIPKKGFIWSNVQFYLSYDYIIVDLEKEFENRIIQGNRFSQAELMAIILGITKGFVHLQPTQYNSVSMQNIYLCQREIRVAHPKLFNYKSNLQLAWKNQQQKGIYLAPEQLEALQKGEKDANYGWRANSYAFGMVILSLMNMQHMDQLYNYSACTIAFNKMKELISYARGFYSQRLVSIVENLLKQRPQERISFRSLLNRLTERHQYEAKNIQITLLQEKVDLDRNPQAYKPVTMEQQPHYTNYLAGLIYPKVGLIGQYFDQGQEATNFRQSNMAGRLSGGMNYDDDSVVANQRYFYANRKSQYIGQGYSTGNSMMATSQLKKGVEKPVKEGKGIYRNQDGQLYHGEWHKGEMHGFGKLYWNQHKIRYEGNFMNGKFHGKGVEYPENHVEDPDVDQTFVRMQRQNWMKYQGNYKHDKREGQGIVYFSKSKWIGNFKNGQPNGEGIYYDGKGNKFKGTYKQGVLEQ